MTNLAATFLLSQARRFKRGGIVINEHTVTNAQIRFHGQVLRRWFDFISLEELPARLSRPAKKPFCVLTFDDGKRSHFSQVAPELEHLGIPAAFYVPTDFLSNGSALWFDRREQLVRALGFCPVELEINRLKLLPLDVVTERIENWCKRHEFKSSLQNDDVRAMSWDEARSLHRRGFTIGAHGLTHAILTRETKKRAFAEIEESMAAVSHELGVKCDTFAFPNGNHSRELAMHAVKCGAATVMTTDPEWASQTSPLWSLPRIQLFGSLSQTQIELKIALAAIRGALANPDGSGRRYGFSGEWFKGKPQTGRLTNKPA
jgi:peptidoglycan/xylan/chitin deacetylase (PgdA/CDA1 family)